MRTIILQPGTQTLIAVPEEKIPLCRFVAKAAKVFGEVSKVTIKGNFSHWRYDFLFWTFCLEPEHKETLTYIDSYYDDRIGDFPHVIQKEIDVPDQWFTYELPDSCFTFTRR